MSYSQFEEYQNKAQQLKALQKEVSRVLRAYNSAHKNPKDYFQDVRIQSESIQRGLLQGSYGWSGPDADACRNKLIEIYNDMMDSMQMMADSIDSIVAAIEEERLHYAGLAMNEMNNFSEWDWAVCAWNTKDEWIRYMF